jgi:hypothetical protein
MCFATIVADTPSASAAAAKLPLSTTFTNILMPASLSTIKNPLVWNDAIWRPFISSASR